MNKLVLITGASSGLGKEFAYKYASNGYNLLLVARSSDKLVELQKILEKEYNVTVEIFIQDLSTELGVANLIKFTDDNNFEVNILINNAGFGDFGEFSSSNIEKQKKMIDLNVKSLVELTHHYIQAMLANNSGKILNVASIAGFMPGPYMSVYYATKAFVLNFTEALVEELVKTNVKIAALCPGPTATDFEKNATVKFSKVKMTTVQEVVNYAYKKFMFTNDVVILPGTTNKAYSVISKLTPRTLVRKSVANVQKRFRSK